jgi:hypothetical protein
MASTPSTCASTGSARQTKNSARFMYKNKKAALSALRDNPLSCVEWMQGKVKMSALYWNGRIKILPSNKAILWG